METLKDVAESTMVLRWGSRCKGPGAGLGLGCSLRLGLWLGVPQLCQSLVCMRWEGTRRLWADVWRTQTPVFQGPLAVELRALGKVSRRSQCNNPAE